MNVISAVNPQGKFRFMCVKGRVNAGVFIDVLKRMIESTERKVFLIVDGRPSHKAKKVIKFLKSVADRMEFFFCRRIRRNSIRTNMSGTTLRTTL